MAAKRIELRAAVAVAVVAVVASIAGPGGGAVGDDTALTEPAKSDVTIEAAAVQLAVDYGIELNEAISRIENQPRLDEIAEAAAVASPSSSGAYIDHATGGELVVRSTDPDETARAVERITTRSDSVRVEGATWSTAQLESAVELFWSKAHTLGLAEDLGASSFLFDIERNLVISRIASSEGGSAGSSIVEDVNKEYGRTIIEVGPDGRKELTGCHTPINICDPPLRGGITIGGPGLGGNFQFCTAGFTVVSRQDAKRFVLTAGHCMAPSICAGAADITNFETRHNSGSAQSIGARHHWHYAGCGNSVTDAGIFSVDQVAGWNPHPYVYVAASNVNGYTTVADHQYIINGVGTSSAIPGDYLCKTGSTTRTRCGEFLQGGRTGSYGLDELGYVDIRNCGGDSGGPLYIAHKGYGITEGFYSSTDSIAPVTTYNGIATVTAACGSRTLYVGLTRALDVTNTNLMVP